LLQGFCLNRVGLVVRVEGQGLAKRFFVHWDDHPAKASAAPAAADVADVAVAAAAAAAAAAASVTAAAAAAAIFPQRLIPSPPPPALGFASRARAAQLDALRGGHGADLPSTPKNKTLNPLYHKTLNP